jgi:hypothetical protein
MKKLGVGSLPELLRLAIDIEDLDDGPGETLSSRSA